MQNEISNIVNDLVRGHVEIKEKFLNEIIDHYQLDFEGMCRRMEIVQVNPGEEDILVDGKVVAEIRYVFDTENLKAKVVFKKLYLPT